MKTSNAFIARQCDQAGEVTELDECIASGQVSAAQVEAHRVAGDFVKPAHLNVCPRHDGDMVTDPEKGCPKCNLERAQPVQTTDAELLRNVTNVERRSDQSVTIVFTSCRAASEFGRAAIAASKGGVQ